MKKSNIILLTTILLGLIYYYFPSVFGHVALSKSGEPQDKFSKFWLDIYPQVTYFVLSSPVSHVKIIGKPDATASIDVNDSKDLLLKSKDAQNYTYKITNDTLEIRLKGGHSAIKLNQHTAIQSLTCVDHCNLTIIPTAQGKSIEDLKITLANNSRIKAGEITDDYGYSKNTHSRSPIRINNLNILAENRSFINLKNLQSSYCNVKLKDAMLDCTESGKIDSLELDLEGKSSMINLFQQNIPTDQNDTETPTDSRINIGHLEIFGNTSFLNRKYIKSETIHINK